MIDGYGRESYSILLTHSDGPAASHCPSLFHGPDTGRVGNLTEVIVYIAAAFYVRFAGGPPVDDTTDDPHVQVAHVIAKNVITAGHGT
jgi:hypothetical protein